jgi:hypothetical protein
VNEQLASLENAAPQLTLEGTAEIAGSSFALLELKG